MADRIIKNNKYALFKHNVDKKYEAGIVLSGTDVKAIKGNRFEVRDAFIRVENNELFIWNIIFFEKADEIQKRKLLLHRREINKILQFLQSKKNHGFVISVKYTDKNKIKFDLGIGTIKKAREKKASEKRTSEKRILEKSLKENF